MNSSLATSTRLPNDEADYPTILPVSMALAMLAALIACVILAVVFFTKRLHTPSHLLICNTCVWTVICCVVQTNNHLFVLVIKWDTSDLSCRFRGYFAYMSIAGVIYSYLAQAISRFFFVVLANKFPRIITLKAHGILIAVQWLVVISAALPAIATEDIFYRPNSLCWVTRIYPLHTLYTFIAYYCLPTVSIVGIYVYVYRRVKRSSVRTAVRPGNTQSTRDLKLFRNILILLGIYLSGGLPTSAFIFTYIAAFYAMGIIFVSLTMVIEKTATIFLDREIHNTVKKCFCRSNTRVMPTTTVTVVTLRAPN